MLYPGPKETKIGMRLYLLAVAYNDHAFPPISMIDEKGVKISP